MNNAKEKKSKFQITMAVLVFTVILFSEMYLMINFPSEYILIILLATIALIAVYVVINAVMTINDEKEAVRNENLESLYRSEKAFYIMLKKSFDEIEEKLGELKDISKIPSEEIINAQKGIAKVIINRSKENADAIINSNDQVIERLEENEDIQNLKVQDFVMQLKDTELRLNQAIMNSSKVVMQTPPTYVSAPVQEMQVEEYEQEIVPIEDIVIEESEVEEIPLMPDLSDPNKVMSPDDIEALFANLSEDTITDDIKIEEPEVEEVPPMPDLSDPNKVMSPEEIAALIANL